MCGLVGVASVKLTDQVKKAFYDMLYFDVVRGEDSTGVASISDAFGENTEVGVFKSVGSATDFFWEHGKSARDRSFTAKPASIFIGHNRFATQGAVNKDNAHPFEFPNLVGAHNGTVLKWSLRDFVGHKDYEVDSQIIYSHLSHTQNIDEVWKQADGAMALVWWDKVTKNLNIIRNKERPLTIIYSEDDKTVFWASESWMIYVAAMRQNIKLKEPVEVKPNVLFTFSQGEEGKMAHTTRELPPFVEKVWGYQGGNFRGANYYDDWFNDEPPTTKKHVPPATDVGTKLLEDRVIMIREFHDVAGSPAAVGFTEDGSLVKVMIPLAKQKEAKNKITGRGTSGLYIAKKLYRNVTATTDFWCHWEGLHFVKLKPGSSILKGENNSFTLEGPPQSVDEDKDLAPWFEPHHKLNQSAYLQKTSCGCLNCLKVPNWGAKDTLYWVDQQHFFCYDCQLIPVVQDTILEQSKLKKDAA